MSLGCQHQMWLFSCMPIVYLNRQGPFLFKVILTSTFQQNSFVLSSQSSSSFLVLQLQKITSNTSTHFFTFYSSFCQLRCLFGSVIRLGEPQNPNPFQINVNHWLQDFQTDQGKWIRKLCKGVVRFFQQFVQQR